MKATYSTIISGLFLLTTGCTQKFKTDFNFRCAEQLTEEEINTLTPNHFNEYSESDLDFLADITTLIAKENGDTLEFEVFYNQKKSNSMTIDIYGFDDMKQIDKTVCSLFNRNGIKIPQQTTLLFHKYVKGNEDGGIIVGLTNKNE